MIQPENHSGHRSTISIRGMNVSQAASFNKVSFTECLQTFLKRRNLRLGINCDKNINIIAARHELLVCKQMSGDSVDEFVIRLQQFSKRCHFQNVTVKNYRVELIRNSLIA